MTVETFWWWSQEQKDLAKRVNKFVDEHIEEAESYLWKKQLPLPLLKKIGAEGYFGSAIPKKYGGLELGATGTAIVCEQISRLVAVGTLFGGSTFGGLHQLLKHGTEEQKQKWLTKMASGESIGAITITEPFAGSDAANVMTTAVKEGDNWIVNGKKRFITGGGIADRYLMYARTSKDPEDRKNYSHITTFILEKGTPGFSLEKINSLIGLDMVPNAVLSLEDAVIPDKNRIGSVGKGWNVMMAGLNFERTMAAAGTIGGFLDTIRLLFHYTTRRIQFNKTTSRLQGIQNEIADIIANYKLARLFVYHLAKQIDDGQEPAIEASIAKNFATEAIRDMGLRAVQVLGGDGLTKFYPVERIIRSAKIGEIAAGTTEINKYVTYRMASRMALYTEPVRFQWNEEVNAPIRSLKESKFKGLELNEENILKVIAHNYKIHPGLYMTPDDVRYDIGGSRGTILEIFNTLAEKELIVTHHDRAGKVSLVKATYDGLRKAFPKEYYRWFPDWYPDSEKF